MRTHFKELVEERIGKGVTQEQIAKATGIGQSTVSRWWNGKVDRFDSGTVLKFCQYLNCEVGDLIAIEYEPGELAS